MAISDQLILDAYNSDQAGNTQDAIGMGRNAGNPWLINIANSYKQIFGRLPTVAEVEEATPAFQNPGGHGQSFIAEKFQLAENTPDKIYARQQEEYKKKAPEHYGSVNEMFQSQMGRDASQEELEHFGKELASGTTDKYQLQQFLQQQPEYQSKQNDQFRTKLSDELSGYDKQYFGESILPSIQQAYAKQGRSFDSSSFQSAATNSAQQQNVSRQQYLAGLSAQQYGGVQDRAYQDYANMVANQQNLTNQGIQAQYAGSQRSLNRMNTLSDFNIQNQMYNQYLAKYGKRDSGIMSALQGAIGGAGVGAQAGGGWGAVAGGVIGGGLGYAGGNY